MGMAWQSMVSHHTPKPSSYIGTCILVRQLELGRLVQVVDKTFSFPWEEKAGRRGEVKRSHGIYMAWYLVASHGMA